MSQDRKRFILIILLCGVLISSSILFSIAPNNTASVAIKASQVPYSHQKNTEIYESEEITPLDQKIAPKLQEIIENASSDAFFNVIVSTLPSEVQKISRRASPTFQIKHTYEIIPAFNGIMVKTDLDLLSQNPGIIRIEPNYPVFGMLDTARPATGVDQVYNSLGINGSGVRVAVIDSGIDDTHVDLIGKVVGWKDFINDKDEVYDDRGHGTHIAGIIAGLGNQNSDYRGIAPGADLLGVKILDEYGQGTLADVIAGIEWSVKNNVDIINLSLGTRITGDGTTATDMAVNRAVELGSTVVVSAGNFGPNGSQTIGIPGTAENAITVGAIVEPTESST
jgi:serine protease AprX